MGIIFAKPRSMRRYLIFIIAIFCQFMASAQHIEHFTLTNVTTGSELSLVDYRNNRGIVIVFFSGKCAYSNYYIDRILALDKKFKHQGVPLFLINSNASEFVSEESVESMKAYTVQHGINFPYLADKDKKIKSSLKATRTPEAFLFQPTGDSFKLIYSGAIDDNPQSASDVDHEFLQEAIVNLLENSKIEMEHTRPVGCLIK